MNTMDMRIYNMKKFYGTVNGLKFFFSKKFTENIGRWYRGRLIRERQTFSKPPCILIWRSLSLDLSLGIRFWKFPKKTSWESLKIQRLFLKIHLSYSEERTILRNFDLLLINTISIVMTMSTTSSKIFHPLTLNSSVLLTVISNLDNKDLHWIISKGSPTKKCTVSLLGKLFHSKTTWRDQQYITFPLYHIKNLHPIQTSHPHMMQWHKSSLCKTTKKLLFFFASTHPVQV